LGIEGGLSGKFIKEICMKVISIQGSQAVGKSTVIRGLVQSKTYNIIGTREFGENEKRVQQIKNFNLEDRCGFLKNQVVFFKGESKRWSKIKEYPYDGIVLDRGPEDTICFSYIHPKVINASWSIEEVVPKLIEKYIKRESDVVIYLYAQKNVLIERKKQDTGRERLIFDKLLGYYPLEMDFYRGLKNTVFVDTTELSPSDVLKKCSRIVAKTLGE
jgi:dephospho-CoA kinase